MSTEHDEPGEGHSPAAWTAVVVMLLGIAVGTLALFLNVLWLVFTGVGIIVIGLILGWVLAKAGFGVNGPKYSPKN